MKLLVSCAECNKENLSQGMVMTTAEFNDSGRYEYKCHKGHDVIVIIFEEKFEILFEIGAYAIADGYYREAVSSFTTALERFYEFFIKVICISKGIEWETILDTWKIVSAQSERQLGAFAFVHLIDQGTKPTLLSNSQIELRNKVIHKGYIPDSDQATKYGQAVLNIIRQLSFFIKENHQAAVNEVKRYNSESRRRESDNGKLVTGVSGGTIIDLRSHGAYLEKDLKTEISNLKYL